MKGGRLRSLIADIILSKVMLSKFEAALLLMKLPTANRLLERALSTHDTSLCNVSSHEPN